MQWRIQGGTRGRPPLFLDQTPYLRVWMTDLPPSPLPEGLNPPTQKTSCTRTLIRKC